MKILGIFYTNNKVNPALLQLSLKEINRARTYSELVEKNKVTVITSVWEAIVDNPFPEAISFYRNNGHLNIITQILNTLYRVHADVVCFLEHDCLYPIDYFERVAAVMENNPEALGVSNLDYIGMNATGYQDVVLRHEPMSQLSMTYQHAVENMEHKLRECILHGSSCVEPDDKSRLVQIPYTGIQPAIHVNMNNTGHNHHFTSHADVCYEPDSGGKMTHPYWGNHQQFNFFD